MNKNRYIIFIVIILTAFFSSCSLEGIFSGNKSASESNGNVAGISVPVEENENAEDSTGGGDGAENEETPGENQENSGGSQDPSGAENEEKPLSENGGSEIVKTVYTVTFIFNNGASDFVREVVDGETVKKPDNPVKDGFIFDAWYNADFSEEYDFAESVTENFSLYADYFVDYAALTNEITTRVMKSVVTVFAKSYNTSYFGLASSSQTASGSGIIFSEDSNGYYYLLTNNHVVYKKTTYSSVSYTVEDYRGTTYSAILVHASADYDLAVVRFKKGDEELNLIEFADENPAEGDEIASLGQPKNQSNAITYGKITGYPDAPELKNSAATSSNVKFNVISHDSFIAGGSSGGALLSTDLKLAGINYAGQTTEEDEFVCGFAIPVEKVVEYLAENFYSD